VTIRTRSGRVGAAGFLWICWLAYMSGCSRSDSSTASPGVGSEVKKAAISGLERLESLGVRIVPIMGTPAGPGYTHVLAEGSRIRDEDLDALRAVDRLEILNLSSTQVSDFGLQRLTRLTRIRWLYLKGTRISETGLKALESLQSLTILDVAETAIGDAGLTQIACLTGLSGLDLTGTRVTDAGLPSLAPLKRLEVLRLSKTAVSDAGLKALAALDSLKGLALDGCPGLRGPGLESLVSLPDLRELMLSGSPIDDDGMVAIGRLTRLTELHIEGTKVGDAGLAPLRGLTSLRKLFLNGSRCTEKGLRELNSALPGLFATLQKPKPAETAAPPVAPPRQAVPFDRTADVIYGWKHGMALTMDVLKPGRFSNSAAVVWIISESFYSRHESITPTIPLMDELLARGYHVFAVTHGSTPLFNVEDAIDDVHRAVRFIRHNACSYAIDPARIAALGSSAAGHLALMLGVGDGHDWHFEDPIARGELAVHDPIEDESGRVGAVACFCGPTDWRSYGETGRSVLDHPILARNRYRAPFALRVFDDRARTYREVTDPARVAEWLVRVSPLSHVSNSSAPVLFFHGDKDENVPLQQSRTMVEALRSAGVACELRVKPGSGHGWNHDQADMIQVADWFDRHLPSNR
jgi:acetyl esterase/lipase